MSSKVWNHSGREMKNPLFAQKSLTIRNVRVLGKKSKCRENESGDDTGHPFDGLLFADGDRFLEVADRGRIRST